MVKSSYRRIEMTALRKFARVKNGMIQIQIPDNFKSEEV